MLETSQRILLSEALAPPAGFTADLLVGTTYSLHLGALLSVPLALTFADWEASDGAPDTDPVAALEAVRRHAERITVFCQAGATAATDQPPLVASWLEPVVVPVKAPSEGVFHPKLWVARYRSTDELLYRVVCGSRNLTFDRSWDTALVLDGEPTPRGGRVAESEPLAAFVEALPGLATGSVSPERAAAIRQLASELRRVRFGVPEPFAELTFIPLGLAGHQDDPFTTRRTRMLVMSPFVGSGRLAKFFTERDQNILVSRAEELEKVATGKLRHFARFCSINEPELPIEPTSDARHLTGLHAKLYVADAGHDAHVWTGSANATSAAFGQNVEFLVRLDGSRVRCGIQAFLGDRTDPTSLEAMLVDVEPRDQPAEPDPLVELQHALDEIVRAFAERRFAAELSQQDDGAFVVQLAATPAMRPAPDVAIRCWPLTGIPERDAVDASAGDVVARFPDQPLGELTAFFAFELTLSLDGLQVRQQMLVRADFVGMPEGRSQAILRELLKDPAQFMRLLRALLSSGTEGSIGGPASGAGGGNGSAYGSTETALLESLIAALADAPAKLDAVASLVADLREVDDVLPAGFLEIWEPIAAVHAEQR